MMQSLLEGYAAVYKNLHEEKPITCLTTGITYDAVSAPAVVILDVSMSNSLTYLQVFIGITLLVFSVLWRR